MTSRNNEVRIDIEVEGGAKAERQFARAEKGARGLGRSTRGLINPLLGAGLVSGILGGGLLSLALSSGSASNSIYRIQGALDGLVGSISRSVEPAVDFFATQFVKLPVAAQLAVVALGLILSIGLVAVIYAAAGAVGTAITAGIGGAITTEGALLAATLATATALAISAVVVGLAALALIAWDLIFNDGDLLKRFDTWLAGAGWIKAITKWDKNVLTPGFTKAWKQVISLYQDGFVTPLTSDWEAFSNFFREDWVKFFTVTIPTWFQIGLEKVIGFFQTYFITPITSAWASFRDAFRMNWFGFFVTTLPGWFKVGWERVVGFFQTYFITPLASAWASFRDAFRTDWFGFFTVNLPGWFKVGWERVVGFFGSYFIGPLASAWASFRDAFRTDWFGFFVTNLPGWFSVGWRNIVGLARGFANQIIGILNSLIASFGSLPIPTVSVAIRYRRAGRLRVPYPVFSVSTSPLSSFVSLPTIPTIGASATSVGEAEIRRLTNAPGGNNPAGTTNNYYSLAATDFAREVERIINAPGANSRAVGGP